MAHSVLQWPVGRLHGYGDRLRICRVLSGGRTSAAARGRPFVPDADVIHDLDGAQPPHDGRQTWTGVRIGDWTVVDAPGCESRSDADAPDGRDARLPRPSGARGRDMSAVHTELWSYFLMVIV